VITGAGTARATFGPDMAQPQTILPKTILIVDDEAEIRELLKDIVEALGHKTELARDGFEALAKLKLGIDLALLDLTMPGMDGYEIARRIRRDSDSADIPIIMITALTSREDRLRAVEAGANDFIAKPADLVEVRTRMTSLLNLKEARDSLKLHKKALETAVAKQTDILRQAVAEMGNAQRSVYESYVETLHRLALAAEYKDENTGAHIQRVGSYSGLLAQSLHLPPGEVELVRLASPLHDVGKIGIPESILLKPGALTPEERKAMEQHPLIGERLLRGSTAEALHAAEIVALSHHERWDGNGYPHKLKGSDIPLYGRICTIADVFDALTTERPYKKAFPNDKAFEMLKAGGGTQFDPSLAELFFAHRDEVLHIQEQYRQR
jgi:putative two-component system response regulator